MTVADAVDLVDDRDLRVAGSQEVGVQRVDRATLDRPAGRDERLARHLASEDAQALIFRAATAEQVHLELFQVEDLEQLDQRALHRALVARGRRSCTPRNARR